MTTLSDNRLSDLLRVFAGSWASQTWGDLSEHSRRFAYIGLAKVVSCQDFPIQDGRTPITVGNDSQFYKLFEYLDVPQQSKESELSSTSMCKVNRVDLGPTFFWDPQLILGCK